MSDDFWDNETDVDAEAGPPARRLPAPIEDVDKYRLPKRITAGWVQARLTKGEWAQIKRTQKNLTLNPFVIESMCLDAGKGLSKRSIMARHGLSVATWSRWERLAAEEVQPYALWYSCIMYTISNVEEDLIQDIRLAGQTDWKASKWLLEQLNKDEYGPTPKGTVVNIGGDPAAELSVNHVSDTQAMEIAKIMKAIGALENNDVIEGEVVEDDPNNDE